MWPRNLTLEVVVRKTGFVYAVQNSFSGDQRKYFSANKENIFLQARKFESINYSNNLSRQKKMPILDRTRSFSFSRVIFYENCQRFYSESGRKRKNNIDHSSSTVGFISVLQGT